LGDPQHTLNLAKVVERSAEVCQATLSSFLTVMRGCHQVQQTKRDLASFLTQVLDKVGQDAVVPCPTTLDASRQKTLDPRKLQENPSEASRL